MDKQVTFGVDPDKSSDEEVYSADVLKEMEEKYRKYMETQDSIPGSDGEEVSLSIPTGNGYVAYQKEPSIVPRADGIVPSEAQQPEQEEPDEVIVIPKPTPAQMAANVAKEIASQQAEETRNKLKSSIKASVTEEKKTAKVAEEMFWGDAIKHAMVLNGYRKKYANAINYRFKREYTPEMGVRALETERKTVEVLLNSQHAPIIIKNIGMQLGVLFEVVGANLGFDAVNGCAADLQLNIQSGFFDEECEQMAIEWATLFARPPHERALGKAAYIFMNRIWKNMQGGSDMKPRTVPAEFIQQTQDL